MPSAQPRCQWRSDERRRDSAGRASQRRNRRVTICNGSRRARAGVAPLTPASPERPVPTCLPPLLSCGAVRNVTRADGTVYVASSRATYFAMGAFQPARRPAAAAALLRFCDALRDDAPLAVVIGGLPHEARQAGAIAGALVQAFAVVTGVVVSPTVEQGVQVAGRSDCAGLFANRVFPEEFSDMADRVAHALADLLDALGAEDIVVGNID
jgi:hypothetical protein